MPKLDLDFTDDELDVVVWAVEDSIERDGYNKARHERTIARKTALEKIRRAVELKA